MFSIKRLFKAFQFSKQGFQSAWQTEAAFRDNIGLIVVMQLICVCLQPTWMLWLFFVACNALIVMGELFNTGLEYLADQISTKQHDLLGRAKDVGSAAVLTALLLNISVLGVIIWQFMVSHASI